MLGFGLLYRTSPAIKSSSPPGFDHPAPPNRPCHLRIVVILPSPSPNRGTSLPLYSPLPRCRPPLFALAPLSLDALPPSPPVLCFSLLYSPIPRRPPSMPPHSSLVLPLPRHRPPPRRAPSTPSPTLLSAPSRRCSTSLMSRLGCAVLCYGCDVLRLCCAMMRLY